MKVFKHWKVALAFMLVFSAGAVTGAVGTTLHFKRAFERSLHVENWTKEGMKDLKKDMKLSPEQESKIRVIMEETAHQFVGSFGLAIRESGTNLVTSWARIEKELTPEQRVIYQGKCQKVRQGIHKDLKIDLPSQ